MRTYNDEQLPNTSEIEIMNLEFEKLKQEQLCKKAQEEPLIINVNFKEDKIN